MSGGPARVGGGGGRESLRERGERRSAVTILARAHRVEGAAGRKERNGAKRERVSSVTLLFSAGRRP